MNFKRLKLKVWVEDENGSPVASQISAGAFPTLNPKQIHTMDLDWTDEINEVQYKMIINFAANILVAKYGSINGLDKLREFIHTKL